MQSSLCLPNSNHTQIQTSNHTPAVMQYHHQDFSSVRHRILRCHLWPHSCGQRHDRRRAEKHIWLLLCTSPAVSLDPAGAVAGHHAWGLLPGPSLWCTGVPLPCPVPLPCLCASALPCLCPALHLPCLCPIFVPLPCRALSCASALTCPALCLCTALPCRALPCASALLLTVVYWCASAATPSLLPSDLTLLSDVDVRL